MRVFGEGGEVAFTTDLYVGDTLVARAGEYYPCRRFGGGEMIIFGDGPSGLGDVVVARYQGEQSVALRRDLPKIIAVGMAHIARTGDP